MRRMTRSFGVLAAILIAGGWLPIAYAQDAAYAEEDVIEYRRLIMLSLDEQAAIIGQIVSGLMPNEHVFEHLDAIALLAATALQSFEPQVRGGESKPEVWSNWEDFAERMNTLAAETSVAADRAREVGKDRALSEILDVLTCGSCHDRYRADR